MTTTYSPNPFTLVYDSLWELMERNNALLALIKPANRIKYHEVNDPKKAISDGDLPELALLSSGGESNIMNSSSTSRVLRRYTWVISTGEYQIHPFYNTVSWELYRAMVDWDQVLCALEWPRDSDCNFVVRTNVLNMEEGTTMFDANRDIMGWAGMWSIDVEMHFQTTHLRID